MSPIYLLLLLGFLSATNHTFDRFQEIDSIREMAGDTYAYHIIERAAPLAPGPPTLLRFHHVQRFVLHAGVRAIEVTTGLNPDSIYVLVTLFLIIALLLNILWILKKLETPPNVQTLLMGLMILNPYSFRYYLSFPAFICDIGFQLGIVLWLRGVLQSRNFISVFGVLFALVSRQTTLVLIPGLIYFIATAESGFKSRLSQFAGWILAPLACYWGISKIAVTYTLKSELSVALFGFLEPPPPGQRLDQYFDLFGSGFPPYVPFIVLISLLSGISKKKILTKHESKLPQISMILMILGIIALPIAGATQFTNRTLGRVSFLCQPFLVILLASVFSQELLRFVRHLKGYHIVLLLFLAGLGSFHHRFTELGIWFFSMNRLGFQMVYLAVWALILIICKLAIRSSKANEFA